jgi:hypothetical protein
MSAARVTFSKGALRLKTRAQLLQAEPLPRDLAGEPLDGGV